MAGPRAISASIVAMSSSPAACRGWSSVASSLFRIPASHPINRAQHIRLVELGGGATEFIPAAGIDHEQAAVAIDQHIGRVEIGAVADEEILRLRTPRRLGVVDDRAHDAVRVEARDEKVVAPLLSKNLRVVARDAARRGRSEVREHGHEIGPGARVSVEDVVRLAIHAAVDCVDQPVALTAARMLEEGAGENAFAGASESEPDRMSIPPVITDSKRVSSGRARKI